MVRIALASWTIYFIKSVLDVTERNADPTGQNVGGQLVVDPTHVYADLDELIVNHVQATARRVEELMAHEKYKHGTEDDLRKSCPDVDGGCLLIIFCLRSLLEELCRGQPGKEYVWVHVEPQEARSFLSVFLGK